jgi:hypothetical protein
MAGSAISIVHVGHIGLIPEDERVPVTNWMPGQSGRVLIEAYLKKENRWTAQAVLLFLSADHLI